MSDSSPGRERPSERIQRQIDRLLDAAEEALGRFDWAAVRQNAKAVLHLDPGNGDAEQFLAAAGRGLAGSSGPEDGATVRSADGVAALPASFCGGRYEVERFLGEGGKKRVFLCHDTKLDRDVAFALIKTEGLNAEGEARIRREAQAMGRLGDHPHIVPVYDIGEESGQPYLVTQLMGGGDVEALIEKAPEHRVPLETTLRIADEVCQALEYAHAKGIVHRDLKPGNVWLAADGTAKLGDFGLAVALDQTRLTRAGMMVGTVSYMPPEQAIGGEVTPRSDLYSLGAMLYELVTGRPPFVGDESVAIITQHLNAPPVAPSWHVPDLPAGLEALILRLLEKDPSKRPISAAEVQRMLAAVDVRPRRARAETADQPTPLDPLYRRIFIGREHELRQLERAFDAALSGHGSLAMVVGEPGIGKTALCEQLATYVAVRGGGTLVGHSYEEGSLSLPYLAFVEALRSYVLARDPDGLRADLGSAAADVARIISEVRDRIAVELRPAGDPEDDRWRLLQAVSSFLQNASRVQPLCIVLEDLHWADRGTLDLLLHVARNLVGSRLLIVGTYRDVEVDRAHPLSGTLAELRRQEDFLRIPLRGLTVDEVHRMYEAVRGQSVSWAQAEAVHRQTEGNPLFIQEVIRYIVEEGYVVREGGRWVLAEGTEPGTGLPEGLRDVVGKRLSRLSDSCNRLLAVAAVIGRDFDLQTLRTVANLSEDELLAGIEEAVRVGVLEERSQPGSLRYRFAHAFFRTALYEEMIAARRLRLHQEVARALETQYASRREEHAAELAEHYGQSTDRTDLAKAVEYSELAARRAMSVFAYAEAEQHLRRCLAVQEVLDPDDRLKRCDLLLSLSEAMLPQEEPDRVLDVVAPEAFVLAEELHDSGRAARISIQALEAISRARGFGTTGPQFHEWAERAHRYANEGEVARVYADTYYGYSLVGQGKVPEGHAYIRSALSRARQIGDAAALYAAVARALRNLRALRDRAVVVDLAAEIVTASRTGARPADIAQCLAAAGLVQLETGDRTGAERSWEELRGLAERTRDVSFSLEATSLETALQIFDGRLEEYLAFIDERAVSGHTPSATSGLFGREVPVRAMLLLGRTDEVRDRYPNIESPLRLAMADRAVVLAHEGRYEEVRGLLQHFSGIESDADDSNWVIVLDFLEAAVVGGDRDTAGALARRLAPLSDQIASSFVSVGRLLGEASSLLGDPKKARDYYLQGLEVCDKVHFRPEIALIRLDLAELLLAGDSGDQAGAQEHLAFAIAEFREMKMQPALERALSHRGLLKA